MKFRFQLFQNICCAIRSDAEGLWLEWCFLQPSEHVPRPRSFSLNCATIRVRIEFVKEKQQLDPCRHDAEQHLSK